MENFAPKRIDKITDPAILAELETFPNQPVIWGILDGHNKGHIWELPGGKSVLFAEDNFPESFVFIAGSLDEKAVDAAIDLYTTDPMGYPMIYCNPSCHHLFLSHGWDFNLRVQFSYKMPTIQVIREGLIVKPIDNMALFEKCIDFKEMSRRFGSPERFLDLGRGYALCEGEQVISEAYIAFKGRNFAEISVATHPEYRRLGAASQVASYLVEECVAKRIIPIWSCNADNKASLNTALKIGFRIESYYVQMIPKIGG